MVKENFFVAGIKRVGRYIKVRARQPSFWIEQVIDIVIVLSIYLYILGVIPGIFAIIPIGIFLAYEVIKTFIGIKKEISKKEGEN